MWPHQDVGALQQIRLYKTVSSACNSPPQNCYDAATPWSSRSGATSPSTALPPTALYISFQIYKAVLGEPVPQWLRFPAYMLVLPATFAAGVLYARIKARRDASLRGAVNPPTINARWPGGVDKLSALVWNFSNGYLGKYNFSFRCSSFDANVLTRMSS